ncbi:MAG: hypothetical protein AAFQ98_14865 [Bacteroidota bacterium]
MSNQNADQRPVDIRWKDYIPTPKRHQIYLWLGAGIVVAMCGYLVWESFQSPSTLPDRIFDIGVYLLIGVLLVLRGFRVHFLRHAWFIEMDDLMIKYRMVLGSRSQKVLWSDIAKIKIAFEKVHFHLKNGQTRMVKLENVPDEDKIEEAKQAIINFGRTHSIPVTK